MASWDVESYIEQNNIFKSDNQNVSYHVSLNVDADGLRFLYTNFGLTSNHV